MKGKLGIMVGAAVLALGAGFYTYQSYADSTEPIQKATEIVEEGHLVQQEQNNDVISREEAKQIALNEFQGKVVEIELDEDDGRWVYEIEIEDGKYEAELELDAVTGEIIEKEIELED